MFGRKKTTTTTCRLSMNFPAFPPVLVLVLWLQAALCYVEPPANVSFRCHNMHNVLKWSYKKPSPGQRFKITIGAEAVFNGDRELWVDPPAPLEADLSFLSDPENTYLLTLTAVNGQNESNVVPEDEIVFSYFKDSLFRTHKCFVDFPPVNVTARDDGTILFSFTHPWLVYFQNLPQRQIWRRRKKKSHDDELSEELPVFYYMVDIKNQRHHGKLHCMDSVCEDTLVVDAAQNNHCLKFHGELKKMSVHATKEYCVQSKEETSYLLHYCVVGSLLGISAVALVLFMLYRKKTSPTTPLPTSMRIPHRMRQWSSRDVPEPVFVPVVGPASPTPLLGETEVTPTVTPAEEELRLPIGVPTEEEAGSDQVEVQVNEDSEYMAGRSLEEGEELNSEEACSGYEKREVVVKLAPGEVTKGYRG